MQTFLKRRQIVLLGVGHTNAHIVRMWRMKPYPDTQLVCVNNFGVATYSGMLPGVLAGQYPRDAMQIDLVRLCAASGVRLIRAEVTGLCLDQRHLLLADRPPLPFDALSIGIGSRPARSATVECDQSVVDIKPMQTFLCRFEAALQEAQRRVPSDQPLRIAIVGTGVAGVEIAFCLPGQLRQMLPASRRYTLHLIGAGAEVGQGTAPATERRIRRALAKANVELRLDCRVTRVMDGQMEFHEGGPLSVDVVVWATGAGAPPLLQQLGLPTDDRGFLLTRDTLQSVASDHVFAVGDTGTMVDSPVPKAGVYAVRQAPVLWNNLRNHLDNKPLEAYRPQANFLKLINTGDGQAIAEYHGFSGHSRWWWKLKDRIDTRFMEKYQNYEPMPMTEAMTGKTETGETESAKMRCAGCGSKVGGDVLSAALARLPVDAHPQVALGLEARDDAAIVRAAGVPLTITADFFPAPLDDPYIVGRLAALNAASDLFAMGAAPFAALALVTLPLGSPRRQSDLLAELLAGAAHEFSKMGAIIAGGHTTEGPQLMVGFSMVANQTSDPPLTKGALRPGDRLLLTKPLGTGVLLAAHMRAQCRAAWLERLIDVMLTSNQAAAEAALRLGVHAMTDITGFGLAGHLLEMLRASHVSAQLDLNHIPRLPGTDELLREGVESTLAPANRSVDSQIVASADVQASPAYQVLFDPQTSGGMLVAVPDPLADQLRQQLCNDGCSEAVDIGVVVEGDPQLHVRAG